MARTLRTLLAAGDAVRGRSRERAALLDLVERDRPLVVAVYGIAGVGKSAVLGAFAADARERGAAVVAIDCRTVEPTERGFLAGLAEAVGRPLGSIAEAADALGALARRVILTLDTYEVFRLLDTWLRRNLVPALHDNTRVVLASREPPVAAWVAEFGPMLRTLPLTNLPPPVAEDILVKDGLAPADAVRITAFTHGHPLSLRLAASAHALHPTLTVRDAAVTSVVAELARIYLNDLPSPTRAVLDAACVVRRPTLSLLAAMLPDIAPQEAYDLLRRLPFVAFGPEGLVVHDTVREAVAVALDATDPVTHRAHRVAAWRQLRRELRAAPRSDLWRYTADLLFLIHNPQIREAFFPTTDHRYAIEQARPADWAAIENIVRRHRPDAVTTVLRAWWDALPESFCVARDPDGAVVGFRCLYEAGRVPVRLVALDPVTAAWREHLRSRPVPRGQHALFERMRLDTDGESPSPVNAALILDLKRIYLERRPALRRIYATITDPVSAMRSYAPLGFTILQETEQQVGGMLFHTVLNDFGPSSIDGWLTDLAAQEMLVTDEDSLLDSERRHLVLDGDRIDLTRLEFDVLQYLHERDGRLVNRATLLRDVWGFDWTGGSNVVEVVVSSLRRKLGRHATALQTVRGAGYRFTRTP